MRKTIAAASVTFVLTALPAMALDPNCKRSHLVLMDNRAEASRREMFASFTNGRKPEHHALTLGELLRNGA